MTKLSLAAILVLGAINAPSASFAQTPSTPSESVVQPYSPVLSTGWYVAPTAGFTSFDGRMGYLPGLRGVATVNRQVGIGIAGNLIGTNHTSVEGEIVRDVGAYGGLYLQYVLRQSDLVHAYLDGTFGAGSFCERSTPDDCDEQDFGVIEPTLNIEVALHRNVQLAAGAGYRFAIAEGGSGRMSSSDLSGMVARTSLVVGMF